MIENWWRTTFLEKIMVHCQPYRVFPGSVLAHFYFRLSTKDFDCRTVDVLMRQNWKRWQILGRRHNWNLKLSL